MQESNILSTRFIRIQFIVFPNSGPIKPEIYSS